jgi:hypothetical protein
MAKPIVEIAGCVAWINACDRETRNVKATSGSGLGYIRPVLSGAVPVIATLLGDGVVWDAFIPVAGPRSSQLFLAGQARRTSCASSDQRVRQQR